uniref:Uncharacterized protein n=1 Tax=Anguilla anguilla TaxID=7936 RepID=A0A0E9UKN2_ANGAN
MCFTCFLLHSRGNCLQCRFFSCNGTLRSCLYVLFPDRKAGLSVCL